MSIDERQLAPERVPVRPTVERRRPVDVGSDSVTDRGQSAARDAGTPPPRVAGPQRSSATADRLLAELERAPQRRTRAARAARWVIHRMLDRARYGALTINDHRGRGADPAGCPASQRRFVGHDGGLDVTVDVYDFRAYRAIVREGSAGLGRGYIEGWWSTDDPVGLVRYLIANLGPLDEARNRWHRTTRRIVDPFRRRHRSDARRRNRDEISAHYDIGNAFFELFLDETMTYSSAVFTDPEMSLADASRHKYDMLLAKLGVGPDHHLLEIGTGWGGMAMRAADTTGCSVTTTTISAEQLAEARRRVAAAGLDGRIDLLDSDWRDLPAVASPPFDRLVSIEMIEAVDWRDYDEFFGTIERCVAPDGLAAIQAICLPDRRWERGKHTKDFISQFVFPNGCLPSVAAIERSVATATHMQVVDVEDLTPHYAETLARWRHTFDDRLDDVAALGLDARFQRLWRFYLAYCEAAFRERHVTVVQMVIAGRAWRGSVTS